jgi:hypothetical protein
LQPTTLHILCLFGFNRFREKQKKGEPGEHRKSLAGEGRNF